MTNQSLHLGRPSRPLAPRTLDDGQQNDDDEEEEGDVEEDAVHLVQVAVRRVDDVTDTAAGAHALVQMEHETLRTGREAVNRSYV